MSSSRTRFMIETLTNLKNNKTKRTAGQEHQGGDAVERMKKFLSALAKKKHGAVFLLFLRCK
jgi:nucleolar MIF4G domain-containing protein 1